MEALVKEVLLVVISGFPGEEEEEEEDMEAPFEIVSLLLVERVAPAERGGCRGVEVEEEEEGSLDLSVDEPVVLIPIVVEVVVTPEVGVVPTARVVALILEEEEEGGVAFETGEVTVEAGEVVAVVVVAVGGEGLGVEAEGVAREDPGPEVRKAERGGGRKG